VKGKKKSRDDRHSCSAVAMTDTRKKRKAEQQLQGLDESDDDEQQHRAGEDTRRIVFQCIDGEASYLRSDIIALFPGTSVVAIDAEAPQAGASASPWLPMPAKGNRSFVMNATVFQIAFVLECLRQIARNQALAEVPYQDRWCNSSVAWRTLHEGLQFCHALRYLGLDTLDFFADDLEMAHAVSQKMILSQHASFNKDGSVARNKRFYLHLSLSFQSTRKHTDGRQYADSKRRDLLEHVHKLCLGMLVAATIFRDGSDCPPGNNHLYYGNWWMCLNPDSPLCNNAAALAAYARTVKTQIMQSLAIEQVCI
jgi:hypothetical protein